MEFKEVEIRDPRRPERTDDQSRIEMMMDAITSVVDRFLLRKTLEFRSFQRCQVIAEETKSQADLLALGMALGRQRNQARRMVLGMEGAPNLEVKCSQISEEKEHVSRMRRVQKCVETLDVLNIKNAATKTTTVHIHEQQKQQQAPPPTPTLQPSVVVTTKWETFDSLFSPTTSGASSTYTTTATRRPKPRFDWELL